MAQSPRGAREPVPVFNTVLTQYIPIYGSNILHIPTFGTYLSIIIHYMFGRSNVRYKFHIACIRNTYTINTTASSTYFTVVLRMNAPVATFVGFGTMAVGEKLSRPGGRTGQDRTDSSTIIARVGWIERAHLPYYIFWAVVTACFLVTTGRISGKWELTWEQHHHHHTHLPAIITASQYEYPRTE